MLAGFVFLSLLASGALAECPNACSGNGDCGTKDSCSCYDGFFGGDCSLRVCPVGKAFVDTPAGDLNHDGKVGAGASDYAIQQTNKRGYKGYESWPNTAAEGGWAAQIGESHFLVECSGKGSCNRGLGVCQCFDGYSGASCQRTTCPNDCSGHGICSTVGEIAEAGTPTFKESVFGDVTYGGVTSPVNYRLWDSDKNRACVCDPGYSGIDCSLRACPVGDDPLTWDASSCGGSPCVSEQQSFSVDGGQAAGSYRLTFTNFDGTAYTTAAFSLTTTGSPEAAASAAAAVKGALQGIPNNVTGTVIVSAVGGGATAKSQLRIRVTFSTKSGNIPAMVLEAQAGAGRSYLFQPSQPVQTLTFPAGTGAGAPSYRVQYKIFPTDTSLFPGINSGSYWTSAVSSAFTFQLGDVNAAATVVAAALNSIPVISYAFPGFFVADSNVIGVPTGLASQPFQISAAFPDFLTGSIAMSVKIEDSSITNFDQPSVTFKSAYVTTAGDNVDGNREAVTCSNRGLCDFTTGLCSCFAGQTGEDCSQQSALARGGSGSSAH